MKKAFALRIRLISFCFFFFIASVASSRLFLTNLSLTSFTSVTPRVETIEPAHTIMMKMKNIRHTLLNVAMAFVSSASCADGTGTS